MMRKAALIAGLLMVLSAGSASAATTKTVSIYGTYYSPTPVKVALGDSVKWTNTTGATRTVSSDAAMLSTWFFPNKTVAAHTTSTTVTFPAAGTFLYHDTNNASLRGKVKVPMKTDTTVVALPGGTTTIVVGTTATKAPMVHLVQARLNGGAWTTVYSSTGMAFTFKPSSAGTWQLRACIYQALSHWYTGWSPLLTVTAF
jgi:plastocyanin